MQEGFFFFSRVRALERSCYQDILPAPETDREISGPEKNENLMEIFSDNPSENHCIREFFASESLRL